MINQCVLCYVSLPYSGNVTRTCCICTSWTLVLTPRRWMTWPPFWLRSVLFTVFCPIDYSVLPHYLSWPPFWLRSVLSSFLPHWSQCFAPLMSWPPFWLRSVLSTVFCPIDHSVLPRWSQCFAPLITVFCPVDDLITFLAPVSSGHSTLLHCFALLVA